jgi:hypothetical protein
MDDNVKSNENVLIKTADKTKTLEKKKVNAVPKKKKSANDRPSNKAESKAKTKV